MWEEAAKVHTEATAWKRNQPGTMFLLMSVSFPNRTPNWRWQPPPPNCPTHPLGKPFFSLGVRAHLPYIALAVQDGGLAMVGNNP